MTGPPDRRENLEIRATGLLGERDGRHYCLYDETSLTGMEGTKTTLKWDAASFTIIRRGTFEVRQEFRERQPYECIYRTPYLTLPLRVVPETVRVAGEGLTWHIHIGYALEVSGSDEGDVSLDIEIEEDTESGHQEGTG